MLMKAAEERGLRILWLPIRYSLYEETALAQFQALTDPNKPMVAMKEHEREKTLSESVRRIAEVAGRKY